MRRIIVAVFGYFLVLYAHGYGAVTFPYSGTMNISGKYGVDTWVEQKDREWRLETPWHYFGLDMRFSLAQVLDGFARLSFDTGEDRYALDLDKAHLRFSFPWLSLLFHSNEKVTQLCDPLNIMRGEMFLRKKEILLYDTVDRNLNFGLGTQGVLFQTMPWDTNIVFFGCDNFNSGVDTFVGWASREVGLTRLTLLMRSDRGIKYPYSNPDNNWFPTPESAAGLNDTGNPVWYEGTICSYLAGGLFEMDLVPGHFRFFEEYVAGKRELVTTHWNEGAGTYADSDKSWPVYDERKNIVGFRGSEDLLSWQVGWRQDWWDMTQYFGEGEARDEGPCAGLTLSMPVVQSGVEASWLRHKKSDTVDSAFDPLVARFWLPYQVFDSSSPLVSPGQTIQVLGTTKWTLGPVQLKLNALFGQYEVSGPDLSTIEVVSDLRIGLLRDFFIFWNARTFSLFESASNNFFHSHWAGIGWQPARSVAILLGWGKSPLPLSIDDEMDMRDKFLYDSFQVKIADGVSILDAIRTSERNLQNYSRVGINAHVSF